MPEINTSTLSKTKEWFEKAVPNPELKNINSQLGCHCEEVAEMLYPLRGVDTETEQLLVDAHKVMVRLSRRLKENSSQEMVVILDKDKLEFLDAICDQIVTAIGVAHMGGYDIVGAMNEVNASNFSKFVNGNPVFDANHKIIKGLGYRKPNLKPFLKK